MGLPDSEDSLTIGWAVLTQYHACDGHSITCAVWLSHVQNITCFFGGGKHLLDIFVAFNTSVHGFVRPLCSPLSLIFRPLAFCYCLHRHRITHLPRGSAVRRPSLHVYRSKRRIAYIGLSIKPYQLKMKMQSYNVWLKILVYCKTYRIKSERPNGKN